MGARPRRRVNQSTFAQSGRDSSTVSQQSPYRFPQLLSFSARHPACRRRNFASSQPASPPLSTRSGAGRNRELYRGPVFCSAMPLKSLLSHHRSRFCTGVAALCSPTRLTCIAMLRVGLNHESMYKLRGYKESYFKFGFANNWWSVLAQSCMVPTNTPSLDKAPKLPRQGHTVLQNHEKNVGITKAG